jgi:hypothetical protein
MAEPRKPAQLARSAKENATEPYLHVASATGNLAFSRLLLSLARSHPSTSLAKDGFVNTFRLGQISTHHLSQQTSQWFIFLTAAPSGNLYWT